MLEQVRTIDKSRLLGYIGKADKGTIKRIDKAVKISFLTILVLFLPVCPL